jgi:replication initiation and membrane attachment protein DnaB
MSFEVLEKLELTRVYCTRSHAITYIYILFHLPLRKHDFSHILPSCLLSIAESRKYHPVVLLLYNNKWLKKISTKFRQVLKQLVQYILSSILCSSIFHQICRHCNASPLLCPINAIYVFVFIESPINKIENISCS